MAVSQILRLSIAGSEFSWHKMKNFTRIIIQVLLVIAVGVTQISAQNDTVEEFLQRNRRALIFSPHGGLTKFVMSALTPVDLPKGRSLNWAINLQAQYLNLDMTNYNPWKLTRRSVTSERDYSREYLYSLIEMALNRHRKNGRECLLRAICEVTQNPFSGNGHGFMGHILDAIFIPVKDSTQEEAFYNAHLAGRGGVDCLDHFPRCPLKDGILERISNFI